MNFKDYILDKIDFIDYDWWIRTEKNRYILTWVVSLLAVILSIFQPNEKLNLKPQKHLQEKVKTTSKNQN